MARIGELLDQPLIGDRPGPRTEATPPSGGPRDLTGGPSPSICDG